MIIVAQAFARPRCPTTRTFSGEADRDGQASRADRIPVIYTGSEFTVAGLGRFIAKLGRALAAPPRQAAYVTAPQRAAHERRR